MTRASDERVGLDGGTVVTPDSVYEGGALVIEGDRIAAVAADSTAVVADRWIDATGRYVLPGLVDLHGDDVERHRFPRSGDRVDVSAALRACDRGNLAAGVTTKFNAIAFEESPAENRSIDGAADLVDGVAAADHLVADHRVHARCEVSDPGSVEAVREVADRPIVDAVSLMNHAPGSGQFEDEAAFARRYADGHGCTAETATALGREREVVDTDAVRGRVAELTDELADADVALASHDDADPEAVAAVAAAGVDLCEFPVSMEAARRARSLGVPTAMGAPNLVRGGSLWDNLAVADAIDAGVVDVLCSDYRPGALLESVFVDTGEPLPDRVARATSEPASLAGLDERGRLEEGARADVIVVERTPVPTVTRAFVGGRGAYRCGHD